MSKVKNSGLDQYCALNSSSLEQLALKGVNATWHLMAAHYQTNHAT